MAPPAPPLLILQTLSSVSSELTFLVPRPSSHTDTMLGTLCTLITALTCVSGVTVVTQKPVVTFTSTHQSTSDYRLIISNVEEGDSAVYHCHTWDSSAKEYVSQ
ncbi:hypothetical protein OYC64_006065 [Pagothenia borchgrevinki]|uniref:Immunoglobulin V-set domain-containing protein n=1 Tax=Pagothenia borchgrevinki TaxID=8213 RepID=A0ABD2GI67_PAGBO